MSPRKTILALVAHRVLQGPSTPNLDDPDFLDL